MRYRILIWKPASPSNLEKLKAKKIQKRAVRTICRAHYWMRKTGILKTQSVLKCEFLHMHAVAVLVPPRR